MVVLRKQAEKEATTPAAFKDPAPLLLTIKDRMTAEVDAVKAKLAYRIAVVQLTVLIEPH